MDLRFIKYIKYLQYVPVLINLFGFIKEAEQQYQGAGNGAQKLQFVSDKFGELVTRIETEIPGVVTPKLGQALREGVAAIVSVIVQIMNAVAGGVV